MGLAILTIGTSAAWVTRTELNVTEGGRRVDRLAERYRNVDDKLDIVLQKLGKIEGELRRIKKLGDEE